MDKVYDKANMTSDLFKMMDAIEDSHLFKNVVLMEGSTETPFLRAQYAICDCDYWMLVFVDKDNWTFDFAGGGTGRTIPNGYPINIALASGFAWVTSKEIEWKLCGLNEKMDWLK